MTRATRKKTRSRHQATPPRLAVSIGCPSGIGPEVSLRAALALADRPKAPRVLLVGDVGAVHAAADAIKASRRRVVPVANAEDAFATAKIDRKAVFVFQPGPDLAARDRKAGTPSRQGGASQLAWIDTATDLVASGVADALVTGPVSKDAIARSEVSEAARTFRGHTEHIAARLDAPEVTMAFWTEALTTSLVTTHLPIRAVPGAITKAEVARAIFWTASFVAKLGAKAPLAVAALNPHAGENGLLGEEEARTIAPGIALAKKRLARARVDARIEGPVPAESAFRLAAKGSYSAVVAMYHDQATIPMKLLGFGEAVNVSLGLPIVRTSVDHGTAYDRAGTGTADPRGMIEAMLLGARLAT